MRPSVPRSGDEAVADQIRSIARPLTGVSDLDALVERVHSARFVCIGEASHGTSEFYGWRALLSRRLIEEHGFTWIGVEGDWPDCWRRINRWVRGDTDRDLEAVVATNAEHYDRTMVRRDRKSWNIRDRHMVDTIERVATHAGPRLRGLVWEHDTHVGDARDGHGSGRHGQRRAAPARAAARRLRRTAARCSPRARGDRRRRLSRCRRHAPAVSRRSCTRHWGSPPSSSSPTTDQGPGSRHRWGTGRSASSTSPGARAAPTCRRASAVATTP